jgi:hypothetical protein
MKKSLVHRINLFSLLSEAIEVGYRQVKRSAQGEKYVLLVRCGLYFLPLYQTF